MFLVDIAIPKQFYIGYVLFWLKYLENNIGNHEVWTKPMFRLSK
jgi:hypothetical protein